MARVRGRDNYWTRPGRLGQGPPPQPDPSESVLPTYYGGPYSYLYPLLRPSGAYGVLASPTVTARTGGAPTASPDAPAGFAPEPAPLILPPWLFAPRDGFPFIIQPAAPVGPLAVGGTAIVMSLPQLPRGRMARLERFGNSASDLSSAVLWTFLVRGQPTAPIINFWGQYGLVGDARPLPDPGLILQSGDDFQLQITNGTGAPITAINALIIGYSWAVPA